MVVEPTATQAGLVFSSKLNLVVTFCRMTVTSAEQPGRWTHGDSDPLWPVWVIIKYFFLYGETRRWEEMDLSEDIWGSWLNMLYMWLLQLQWSQYFKLSWLSFCFRPLVCKCFLETLFYSFSSISIIWLAVTSESRTSRGKCAFFTFQTLWDRTYPPPLPLLFHWCWCWYLSSILT